MDTAPYYFCVECRTPIVDDDVDVRHSHPDGGDLHDTCCTYCDTSTDNSTGTYGPLTGPALTLIRDQFLDAASAWSEDIWAAGWMRGLHNNLRSRGGDRFVLLAYLAGGWPNRDSGTVEWEPLTDNDIAAGATLLTTTTGRGDR